MLDVTTVWHAWCLFWCFFCIFFFFFFFFFQAEDGIRDGTVTGVQTCALPRATPPTPAGPQRAHRPGPAARRRPGAPAGRGLHDEPEPPAGAAAGPVEDQTGGPEPPAGPPGEENPPGGPEQPGEGLRGGAH